MFRDEYDYSNKPGTGEAPKTSLSERYEAREKAEAKRRRIFEVLELVTVVAIMAICAVAIGYKDLSAKAGTVHAREEVVKTSEPVLDDTSIPFSESEYEPDVLFDEVDNSHKNLYPTPEPPKPPEIEAFDPIPQGPDENYNSYNYYDYNNPDNDPVYQGNAEIGGGGKTIEGLRKEVLIAEAELLSAQIELFKAEHPDMTDEEREELGAMVRAYGNKSAEVLAN